MTYNRICVQHSGYAVVPGDTPEEIQENAKHLKAGDFSWEPVTPDMVLEEMEVMETCGPGGEQL